MYTIVSTLHDFQKFIRTELEKENYTLLCMPEGGVYEPDAGESFIIPPVRVATIPHQNFGFTEVGELYGKAPYILVGMEDSGTGADDRNVKILIQCCVYSTENYKNQDGSDSRIPDELAEIDLLNLLEWIQQKLVKQNKVGGATIQHPIQIGSYASKAYTYPRAYGYLSFDVNLVAAPVRRDWMDKMYK